jgi:microcystin-dependent protein
LRDPSGRLPAYAAENAYSRAAVPVVMNSSGVASAGGSQPHYNMQPYLTLNFVIALTGIFPSRQ